VGVQSIDQAQQFSGRRGGTDLDPNRVFDALEKFDVGMVKLARAFSDPDKMSGAVIAFGAVCELTPQTSMKASASSIRSDSLR